MPVGYVSIFRAKIKHEALVAYGEALEEYYNTAVNGGSEIQLQERRRQVEQASAALQYYS
jgi:type VI protein secretion system component VasK